MHVGALRVAHHDVLAARLLDARVEGIQRSDVRNALGSTAASLTPTSAAVAAFRRAVNGPATRGASNTMYRTPAQRAMLVLEPECTMPLTLSKCP